MEIEDLAKKAITYFVSKERDDGSMYWTTTDDRPEWLQELIRRAHRGYLPDDYKYEFILSALNIIADSDEDTCSESIADSIDVYTGELTRWLASHIDRVNYVNEALQVMNTPEDDLVSIVANAQYLEREEVFYSVLSSLKAEVE